MNHKIFFIIILLLIKLPVSGQQIQEATTDITEQKVVLYPNGTWEYRKEKPKAVDQKKEEFIKMTDRRGVLTKIMSVSDEGNELSYQKNPTDRYRRIRKSEILMMNYSGGRRDKYKGNEKEFGLMSEADYKLLAKKHSVWYCSAYKGWDQLAMCTSISLTPIVGLIPVLLTAKAPISQEGFHYPDPELASIPAYKKQYEETATKRKKKKIWLMWGIGGAINLGVTGLIIAAATE